MRFNIGGKAERVIAGALFREFCVPRFERFDDGKVLGKRCRGAIFSSDGQSIAFTGVTSEVDGRLDIYSSTSDGFGAVNLTADFRGINTLIGWIGR